VSVGQIKPTLPELSTMAETKLFITSKNVTSSGPEGHYCDVEVFTRHAAAVECAYEMAKEYCQGVERRHTGTYDVANESGGYTVSIQVIKKSVDLPVPYDLQGKELRSKVEGPERSAASV
jgi:hypothetical protein